MTDFKNNLKLSLLMRIMVFLLLVLGYQNISAQQTGTGKLSGNLLDGKYKAVEGASLKIESINDSLVNYSSVSKSSGVFSFEGLPFGIYKIRITHIAYQPLVIDSIQIREERRELMLSDLVLHAASTGVMDEVIVYVEKPLIEVKEGTIIFNASESPQSAGSSASELLENVPLVSKDASGNITVRGKEPRILIDDKPVELNLQQLQDLLESMPGSSIEKIEVMTNPPPQYANEQGGVINIVTRKGIVGISGRVNLTYGTRNQAGLNGSFNYRKQGFNLSIVAGTGYNQFAGNGYSKRANIFTDSVNHFNTTNDYVNKTLRPNFRINLRYDINKFQELSLVINYNRNHYNNENETEYFNLNRFEEIYRLRKRLISSEGFTSNPSLNLSYSIKTKRAGETLRLFTSFNSGKNKNERIFNESFLNPDYTSSGKDSLQQQINDNLSRGMSVRLQYDLPFANKKTFISAGGFINLARNEIDADAFFWSKTGVKWMELEALTNALIFHQRIFNLRASAKHLLSEKASITAGLSTEQTSIGFDLAKSVSTTTNQYWSYLPFATFNKNWEGIWNLSFSYRKSIRRPGIGQLNPTIDFSDPFNTRFGNPALHPSYSHNYDVVIGRNKNDFFFNLGLGHNKVVDIFNSIRTRISSDTTQTTWLNISDKKEYEVSAWSGYKINKQLRFNFSSSYVYNVYGEYDKAFRKFRDGGSFTTNLSAGYSIKDIYSASANLTYNRFANPQGRAGNNVSMNIGVQGKFFDKKLVISLSCTDPFVQQRNHLFTYGTNFFSENFRETATRNYRISVAYAFRKTIRSLPKSSKEKINAVLEGS